MEEHDMRSRVPFTGGLLGQQDNNATPLWVRYAHPFYDNIYNMEGLLQYYVDAARGAYGKQPNNDPLVTLLGYKLFA